MECGRFIGGALLVVLAPSVLAGCSKKEEERPPQTGQYVPQNAQGYGAQGAGGQGSAYGQPQGVYGAAGAANYSTAGQGPAGPVAADPSVLQNLIAGALAGGAALLGGATGGQLGPIEQGIKSKASSAAPGMKPDGQMLSANLTQDGHAEGTLTLQPGSCYTVIGFGGFGVFDYQINLISAPPAPPQILAQSTIGVDPVAAAGDQCFRNPGPAAMVVKLDMHLIRGQGLVGAQAYKK
jgi:hypothetical protein